MLTWSINIANNARSAPRGDMVIKGKPQWKKMKLCIASDDDENTQVKHVSSPVH